jgi:hypothetical protein
MNSELRAQLLKDFENEQDTDGGQMNNDIVDKIIDDTAETTALADLQSIDDYVALKAKDGIDPMELEVKLKERVSQLGEYNDLFGDYNYEDSNNVNLIRRSNLNYFKELNKYNVMPSFEHEDRYKKIASKTNAETS